MQDHEPDRELPYRRIIKLPFDQRAVPEIAALLGVAAGRAPFQLAGGEVHQLTLHRPDAPPTVMLTLWPTIRRVDAIGQSATVVFTNVAMVELVEGVEVLFRRNSREHLIVTVAGKVIVRA
jgi:hypothetical protein